MPQQNLVSGTIDNETLKQLRDEFLVGLLKLRADIETKYAFNQSRFSRSIS